jgi:hypothetical protein
MLCCEGRGAPTCVPTEAGCKAVTHRFEGGEG